MRVLSDMKRRWINLRQGEEEKKKVVAKVEREETMVRKSEQPDIVGLAGSPYFGPRAPRA